MAQVGDGPVVDLDGIGDDNQDPNQDPDQVLNQVPNQIPNQNPLPFNPFLPNVPIAPPRPQLNWSHFKPKCAGKPDKDVEALLLRTNDQMDTYVLLLVTYTKILPIVLPTCRPTSEPTYCPVVGQHVS